MYDASAGHYARWAGTDLGPRTEASVDLECLGTFAGLVAEQLDGLVADVGCGPGRAAAFLERAGLNVVAFDLSVEMVAIGRDAHPAVGFGVARLAELPVADRSLAGVVSWYSIIHTPPRKLRDAFVELARVLVSGGHLLVAFQSGAGEEVHRQAAHGTAHALTSYRHSVDQVVEGLAAVGFTVTVNTTRGPELEHESTPQSFLGARLPTGH